MPENTARAALEQTIALSALSAAFPGGWVFTADGGRWLADPPLRFVPIWGPFEAANPIALAAEVAEVQTCQEISDMQEETCRVGGRVT